MRITRVTIGLSAAALLLLALPTRAHAWPAAQRADTLPIHHALRKALSLEGHQPDSAFLHLERALGLLQALAQRPAHPRVTLLKSEVLLHYGRLNTRYSRNPAAARAYTDSAFRIAQGILPTLSGADRRRAERILSECHGNYGRMEYAAGNLAEAKEQFARAMEVFSEHPPIDRQARMSNNLGVLHLQQSQYAQALIHLQKAQGLFEELGDSLALAQLQLNIGAVTHSIGVYEKSLESYLAALSFFKRHNQPQHIASTQIHIGDVFINLENPRRSLGYYRQAKCLYRAIGDRTGMASALFSLGSSYNLLQRPDSAFPYLMEAIAAYRQLDDRLGQADALEQLGRAYSLMGKPDRAESAYRRAIGMNRALSRERFAAISTIHLANLYLQQGQPERALSLANTLLRDPGREDEMTVVRDVNRLLSQIYERMGRYDLALKHHHRYFELHDSIFSREREHKLAQMEAVYRLGEKERRIGQLEKDNILVKSQMHVAQLSAERQRLQLVVAFASLIIISLVVVLLSVRNRANVRANQLLKQQNAEISQQKEQILTQRNELEQQRRLLRETNEQLERFNWLISDSISSASSIQMALMPSPDVFEAYFSDHFNIFFPRDVVSGDFFWACPKGNTLMVAVADCTGHGVPGGFMSMLGITALTELIGQGLEDPGEILDNLRLLVIKSLNQSGKIGEQQEGMVMSVLRYTMGEGRIAFAGAQQPLWVVRPTEAGQGFELIEQKGDRMPIGYSTRTAPFTTHQLTLQPHDRVYLFTDGFRDQLDGASLAQKYGMRSFRKLILSSAHLPMYQQKSILEDAFYRWGSGADQTDDITILGLRV